MKIKSADQYKYTKNSAFTIIHLIKIFKYQLLLILLMYIINELSQILNPYLLSTQYASIEQYYHGTMTLENVLYINIRNTIFWCITIIFSTLCKIRGGILFTKIESHVKLHIFRFFHHISYEDFLQIQGEKAFNFLKNMEYNVKEILSIFIVHIFANLWTILINIGILLYVVPPLGSVTILWLMVHFIFLRITLYFTKNIGEKVYDVKKNISHNILESFLHILMIKVNNTQHYEEENLTKDVENYEQLMTQSLWRLETSQMISHLISEIIMWGLGIYVLLYGLAKNPMPLSKIFYIIMVLYSLVGKVRNISVYLTRFLENIKEYNINKNFIMNYKIPKYNRMEITWNKEEPAIALNNVSFSMNGNTILQNIWLNIKQGERVCFIGPSGSGKSTLINLFTGIYKKYQGNITMYGQNIAHIPEEVIVDFFSIINQTPMLFNRSIMENITQGKIVPMATIEYYCKLVQIHDFITSLPQGYNTVIHGKNISGGQAQRLCLARMLLREKPIYVFDEATTGLDQKTKAMFLASIFDLLHEYETIEKEEKKTMIFIDHSLAFLHKVDRIIMMEDGKIIFNGTYKDILKFDKFINLQNHII